MAGSSWRGCLGSRADLCRSVLFLLANSFDPSLLQTNCSSRIALACLGTFSGNMVMMGSHSIQRSHFLLNWRGLRLLSSTDHAAGVSEAGPLSNESFWLEIEALSRK